MKLLVAISLVTIAMCSGQFQRQTVAAGPYHARGWRPQGAPFSLPQQTYGAPPQTYGPPPTDYNPPEEPELTTTTEPATTTEAETEASIPDYPEPDVLRLTDTRRKSAKLEDAQGSPVFLVVPQQQQQQQQQYGYVAKQQQQQRQNYIYALQRSAALVASPQTVFFSSSKLQAVPIVGAEAGPYPYGSYVQVYQ